MHIYELTPIGKKLARSVSNPDSPAYQVIAHLDRVGHSTAEQTAEFCGIDAREASSILSRLSRSRPKIVAEVGGPAI